MANLTFPTNPTNGQKYIFNGKVFEYSSSTGRWSATRAQLLGSLPDDVTIPTPVVTLSQNNVEFDALSNNFVNVSVDQDVKITVTNQTTNATAVYYSSNSTLKVDTSAYDIITGVIEIFASNGRTVGTANLVFSSNNDFPLVSLSGTEFSANIGDPAFTVTVTAVDPENQGLTYTSTIGGYANALASVTNSANVYTITPSSSSSDEGTAIVTFNVSDGVKTASKSASIIITAPPVFTLTGLSYTGIQNTDGIGGGDMYFSPDGSYLFTASGGTTVSRYTMSTPWDITTLSLSETLNIDASVGDNKTKAIHIFNNGTRLFTIGDEFRRASLWRLNTPYSLTGATYLMHGSVSNADPGYYNPTDAWHLEGGSTFVGLDAIDRVLRNVYYDPATYMNSWSLNHQSSSIGASATGFTFSPDGTKLFVCYGTTTDNLKEWSLSTPFDVSSGSATFVQSSTPIAQTFGNIFWKPDSRYLYATVGGGFGLVALERS